MGELDADVNRSELLKRAGFISVAALTGVVTVDFEGDAATEPFNLTVTSGSGGATAKVHVSPVKHAAITYVQVADNGQELLVPVGTDPSKTVVYKMPSVKSHHFYDGSPSDILHEKIVGPLYVVIVLA